MTNEANEPRLAPEHTARISDIAREAAAVSRTREEAQARAFQQIANEEPTLAHAVMLREVEREILATLLEMGCVPDPSQPEDTPFEDRIWRMPK